MRRSLMHGCWVLGGLVLGTRRAQGLRIQWVVSEPAERQRVDRSRGKGSVDVRRVPLKDAIRQEPLVEVTELRSWAKATSNLFANRLGLSVLASSLGPQLSHLEKTRQHTPVAAVPTPHFGRPCPGY